MVLPTVAEGAGDGQLASAHAQALLPGADQRGGAARFCRLPEGAHGDSRVEPHRRHSGRAARNHAYSRPALLVRVRPHHAPLLRAGTLPQDARTHPSPPTHALPPGPIGPSPGCTPRIGSAPRWTLEL
eukprot:scaffold8247_cov116-Isochrysis_galbana.AAC.4